jgi:1-aminocyclopropane-1-carboxylate deaminase
MSWFETDKSVLQELHFKYFSESGIRLLVKRDDLIDPYVSGNKWRKLKYIVELAFFQKKVGLLTLGGAYSNHLLATAAACARTGLRSVGFVRGDELTAESNANLKKCNELGMELIFLSRSEYAERKEKERREIWKQQYPSYLFVPEGGACYHGLIGCQELSGELPEKTDHVFVAQGTTTTSCGLLLGLPESVRLHVVPALKGFHAKQEMHSLLYTFLTDDELIADYLERVTVYPDYHFGGYGKTTKALNEFIHEVYTETGLPLDSVYTAKAFYALMEELKTGSYSGQTVVLFTLEGCTTH